MEQTKDTYLYEKMGELRGRLDTFSSETRSSVTRIEDLASKLNVQTNLLSSELAIKTSTLSSELAGKTSTLSSELAVRTSTLATELATKATLAEARLTETITRVDSLFTMFKVVAAVAILEFAVIGWIWTHGKDAIEVGTVLVEHSAKAKK